MSVSRSCRRAARPVDPLCCEPRGLHPRSHIVACGRGGAVRDRASAPAPVLDLGHVVAIAANVLVMVDQLFPQCLLRVGGARREAGPRRSCSTCFVLPSPARMPCSRERSSRTSIRSWKSMASGELASSSSRNRAASWPNFLNRLSSTGAARSSERSMRWTTLWPGRACQTNPSNVGEIDAWLLGLRRSAW